jgi:hypothetical protein
LCLNHILGAVEFISETVNVIHVIIKPLMFAIADSRALESEKKERDDDP